MKALFSTMAAAVILHVGTTTASEAITPEPGGASYHFVSHYSVEIGAPAAEVWTQLVDLGSWMYEFDLTFETGKIGEEGAIQRLYAGQDFFIQTTQIIPNTLLVFANLPSSFNGEDSTGVAVISLVESEESTTVNLTMSRRYSWDGTEPNPSRLMRESPEFQERTRAMWQDRFLGRLKSLVEAQ